MNVVCKVLTDTLHGGGRHSSNIQGAKNGKLLPTSDTHKGYIMNYNPNIKRISHHRNGRTND